MLKLRRIELQGFKSFYDRCEIAVGDSPITAIVGPNGCGKSNISDALAWVLGSQSPKSLRGEKMEDVIFNGTRQRAPSGLAEVAITLIDPEGSASGDRSSLHRGNGNGSGNGNGEGHAGPPAGSREILVERRLYRSGESIYLIDGRPCRLRDIHDLFLGTGLGSNSYAIIEQGRIGLLLSSRPSDRRGLIEEAAGITKFKAKRKLAESRLDAARQNLSRVNDILAEVDRQRNSLKRQASKARRFLEFRRRMHQIMRAVFATRADHLVRQQDLADEALIAIAEEGRHLDSEIARLEALVHEQRAQAEHGERNLEQIRSRHGEVVLELEKTIQRIERMHDQIRALEEREAALSEERIRAAAEIERNTSDLERKEILQRDIEQTMFELQQQLDRRYAAVAELHRFRETEEQAVARLRADLFAIVGRDAQVRNQLSTERELIGRLAGHVERLSREETEARTLAEKVELQFRAAQAEQLALQSGFGQLKETSATAEAELAAARTAHADAVRAAADARAHEDSVRHRLNTIQELVSHRAYSTESVQQFFNAIRGGTWAPLGILADFMEVQAEYEGVVEDFLRHELEYVLVDDLSQAERALHVVRGVTKGRLDCLVLDPAAAGVAPAVIEGAIPVLDVVRLDSRLGVFRAHLRNLYIVETWQRAWDLAQQHPDCAFAARSGETVRGRVVGWGERSQHGPLSLKRELRDLDRGFDIARQTSAGTAAEASRWQQAVSDLELRRTSAAAELQEAEKSILRTDHHVAALRAELDRVEQQWRLAKSEIDRLDMERRHLEQTVTAGEAELVAIASTKHTMETEIQTRSGRAERLRVEADQAARDLADLRSQLAVLDERRSTFVREVSALRQTVQDVELRLGRADTQIQATVSQRGQARASIESLDLSRHDLLALREQLDATIGEAQAALETLRTDLRASESGWDETRARQSFWKDRHTALEIEKTQVESDIRHLAEICLAELNESIESVCLRSFEILPAGQMDAFEKEYQELREKTDAMAPINMMAVEEYQEAEQRFEFLTSQRADLIDSIRDTTQAIEEIDSVCRQQFREAFAEINARFKEAFVELFGGGHGELRLIEEAQEADAGIEIIAQPPGKKLQNVLLLSGGEKALAALALLIALFRFKPSPFCVLDEVDAPLDDANVDRFANMVRLMSDVTQFIIITHSKRTMEVASTLYGVTMEEAGVSKVVSVRLN